MNNPQKKVLRSELKAAGASDGELKELVDVASGLSGLKSSGLPQLKQPRRKLRSVLAISVPAAVGLVIGMLVIVASQTVLPGSPLYPVQASSDRVAAAIDPSYRGTIMMRRAEQVKQLISSGAPSNRVFATLADYKKQAAGYKSEASNYAAFEYCKNNLQQAAVHATNNERQAINETLSSLTDV